MPIIAEIGQNHLGQMKLATQMIKSVKNAGASLVKFQLYDSLELYGSYSKTELSRGQAEALVHCGKDYGIPVFFSVFDLERLKWCKELGLEHYKIAYSQRNNKTLMEAIPEEATLFLSCKGTFDHAATYGCPIKLFCIPCYPTKPEYFTMPDFDDDFDGFSDHTVGLDVAKVAISRGAFWIEKHYCIDHNTGVDAPWSMTADELKELVEFENLARPI